MLQREGEEWKNIIDFPIYQISNLGNVRNTKTERELKPQVQTKGYYFVTLYRKDFKQQKQIHKLVCQYFNPNPNNYKVVDHVNCNKIDNRAENLRFYEQKEKQKFKFLIQRKWRAQIMFNKKCIYLGLFTNEEEAGRSYDRKAIELFGEFAKTNFPREDYQEQQ